MNFIEKVKEKLIKQKQSKIDELLFKDEELKDEEKKGTDAIEEIQLDIEILEEEKEKLEKNLLSEDEIKRYEGIKDFLIFYHVLSAIVEEIKEANKECKKELAEIKTDVGKRNKLKDIFERLNDYINRKLEESILLRDEENKENERNISIEQYEQLFSSFSENCNALFDYAKQAQTFQINVTDYLDINRILSIFSNENSHLYKLMYDKIKPKGFWQEIYIFINNMQLINETISDYLEVLKSYYEINPKLIDIDYLTQRIDKSKKAFEGIKKIEKERKKKIKEKEKSEKRFRENKIKNLNTRKKVTEKVKELEAEIERIKNAQTLQKLGYKSKQDASRKLDIPTKDYIIIPIPRDIKKISQLFYTEKVLKIEMEGRTFYTTYVVDTAYGRINNAEQLGDEKAVLLIPIVDTERRDVEFKKSIVSCCQGTVGLNMQALNTKNALLIMPKSDEISTENLMGVQIKHSSKNLKDEVKDELGDDYTEELDVIGYYKIFKGIHSMSDSETEIMRKAAVDCIFENLSYVPDDKIQDIVVNGERFFYIGDEKKELLTRPNKGNLDDKKLNEIIEGIDNYLQRGKKDGVEVDALYGKLLHEYLEYERKAKADYYNEPDTVVDIKGKKISIKPPLASKNSLIARRYTRPNEDIAYKMMKFADLLNRFAHEYEEMGNVELSEKFFDLKKELIRMAIVYSKNNPKIKITTKIDEEINATCVAMEIPGYNVVALHIKNAKKSLSKCLGELETTKIDIPTRSVIMNGGVNEEFLTELMSMDPTERVKIIIRLKPETFQKLILRMGYSIDEFNKIKSNRKAKREFISMITSDKNISDLISKQREESEYGYG